jgi:hypothetical protein
VKRRRVDAGARPTFTDFEQVTIRQLAVDLRRAVDLGLELGTYACDAYILEKPLGHWVSVARAGRSDPEEREEARLILRGAGSMKLYTHSPAPQRLAEVLEEGSREGEVQKSDAKTAACTP